MHATPFRFLDSPESLRNLRQALRQVGLAEDEMSEHEADDEEPLTPNPYHPACLRFACPWLNQPVEVHWHYYWWPDGVNSELGRVSVVQDGRVRAEVNVEELLRQRLAQPLAEVVVESIVAACAELTGKRQRRATQ
jgi:hypothetical protein